MPLEQKCIIPAGEEPVRPQQRFRLLLQSQRPCHGTQWGQGLIQQVHNATQDSKLGSTQSWEEGMG